MRNKVVSILLAILIISVCLIWVGAEMFINAWTALPLLYIEAVFGLFTLSLFLRSWRARMVLLGCFCAPSIRFFLITTLHNAANQVMPMRSGEMTYPYLFKKYAGFLISKGAASLLVIRLYEVFVLVIILLLGLIWLKSEGETGILIGSAAAVLAVTAFLFWRQLPGLLLMLEGLIKRVRYRSGEKDISTNRQDSFLYLLAQEVAKPISISVHLGLALSSLANWFVIIALFWCVLSGVGINLGFAEAVVGSSICGLGQLVPLGTIGNFGPIEAGWTLGFALVGVEVKAALSAGIIMHLLVFASSLLLAFISWVVLQLSQSTAHMKT
jgi:uncharacterized membrane protein YbhN (UPF0104 family)